ncbi:tetraacyldisaccharide 4'-kinase [Rickettsiales bacterium LUAb2]
MIKFWRKKTLLNYLFYPLSLVWMYVTLQRLKKVGRCSRALVICLGNITVGGAGKTPFTIYLAKKLLAKNLKVAILSKGYKSQVKDMLMVDTNIHDHSLAGDEPLLLAKVAPTLVAKDRKIGIEYLEKSGYQVILMDDGMQNPEAVKDLTILLFDSSCPLGNNMVIPAGPLREPLSFAIQRVNMVVAVGKHNFSLQEIIKNHKVDYYEANFMVSDNVKIDTGKQYFAFAGIGNPQKFFTTLKDYGYSLKLTKEYGDHYSYSNKDIEKLIDIAKNNNLRLITTSKDYVKISPNYHQYIDNFAIELNLNVNDEQNLMLHINKALKDKNIIK